ncbi:hypothetical protein [Arthrobacter sp. W4I7]|uniref:hypothetical protein n=1 Tax=Arthrobacter sp. W4I7 TaxID=3042296 RepID=UPI00277D284F|nr:hypothetical protein [Arthrobacter sp. W4I7]MDQ0689905.1 hypothetical protein [Arthrobacter sp. W4I7]
MKKFWYLPVAAAVGAASLTAVLAQASAGPPPAVAPGVVVADVKSGSDTAKAEDSLSTPTPSARITAIPQQAAGETLVAAEPQTVAPVQITQNPPPQGFDDNGGLRAPGVSDDSATHDLDDDNGGLRAPGVSDDGATHDLGDDKGGLREAGDDKGGDR